MHPTGSGPREGTSGIGTAHAARGRLDFDRNPMVVTWEVTRACDLVCKHCRADACPEPARGELDTDEGRRFLDQVASFGDPPPVLVFTGGDPLKRPDLLELVRHGVDAGLPIAVTPASSPLLTRKALRRLVDEGVRRVALSLDGSTPGRHDDFRGEPGSFDTIVRAAGDAADLGLPIQINTTVTASTAPDLPAVADLVEQLGAVMWEVFFLVPVGRGKALRPLSAQGTEDVLDWLYRRQREAPFRLITVEAPFYRRVGRQIEAREKRRRRAEGRPVGPPAHGGPAGSTGDGKGFVFVSHLGEVFPSGFLPLSAGNVRKDSIVDLYRSSELFRTLRDPEQLEGKCGVCEYRFVCGGARARAYALTGQIMAADPFCPYVPDDHEGAVACFAGGDGGRNVAAGSSADPDVLSSPAR